MEQTHEQDEENHMKRVIYAAAILGLAACSSNKYNDYSDLPDTKMLVDKEMSALSRAQIITAVQECQSANMRPVMIYSKRKINGQISEVVVDVSCAPKFGQ
jgi:uncharacterized lipoprotein YmbA